MPPNNEKQAYVPVRGRKLQNANGTAPGMLFEAKAGGKWAVLLPGPPAELQPMFLNEVRPWLAGLTSCALHSLTLRVAGIGESHLEEGGPPAFGRKPHRGAVCQDGRGVHPHYVKGAGCRRCRGHVPRAGGRVLRCAGRRRVRRGRRDAGGRRGACAAENGRHSRHGRKLHGRAGQRGTHRCAGRKRGVRLRRVHLFQRAENARAGRFARNAAAIRRRFSRDSRRNGPGRAPRRRADFGIGITGIAGAGRRHKKEKPVGLVFLAAACENKVYVQRLLIENRTRDTVRRFSAKYALEMLRRLALSLPQPGCEAFEGSAPAHMGGAGAPRDARQERSNSRLEDATMDKKCGKTVDCAHVRAGYGRAQAGGKSR